MTASSESQDSPVGRILIAEDDPDFRRLLSRRAERMGLRIVEAEDGREALEALEQDEFDALVLDLYMPVHNGFEVIAAAREKDPDIQALVLTGSASVESAVEALRAGVYDYLTKPFDSMTTFELALTRALERRFLINENKRLFEENQRLAVTDPLTGLHNRHKLQESLTTELERAKRYGRPLSMIMIDMDDLKSINDTHGHAVGDEALRVVGQAIMRCIRKVDMGTRFGGDEFLVLLPEADEQEAATVAERVDTEIRSIDFHAGPLSASIGVAQWKESYAEPEDFIHAADEAMYSVKHSGSDNNFALSSDVNR
ncbi:MAG: diguanylate cyclase [Anaerolineales bacterium]